jgi:hypothetical protein
VPAHKEPLQKEPLTAREEVEREEAGNHGSSGQDPGQSVEQSSGMIEAQPASIGRRASD